MVTTSIILPTYNESTTIESVIRDCLDVLDDLGDGELVVVDDDSPDGTYEIAAGYPDDRVRAICRDGEPGLATAVVRGFREASGDVYVVADADGQHPYDVVPAFVESIDEGADVAIGARYQTDTRGLAPVRRVVSAGAELLAKLTVPSTRGISDPISGFFAVHRTVVDDVELDPVGYKILLEVLRRGKYTHVREVPYQLRARDGGDSNLDRTEVVNYLRHLYRLQFQPTTTRTTAIAVVTAFPPCQDGLAEYAQELTRGYDRSGHSTVVLANQCPEYDGPETTYEDGVRIERVWEKDSLRGWLNLVRHLHYTEYEFVHFNAKLTWFGENNLFRFLGTLLPLIASLLGHQVVTTMHDVLEGVDVESIPQEPSAIERLGATVATQLFLLAGPVTVTTERFRDLLQAKYPVEDVHHVPHGAFPTRGRADPTTEPFVVLLFGFISRRKDYRTVFEAHERLRDRVPGAEVWVVGGRHPESNGYYDTLEAEWADADGVRWYGFVPDEELGDVFESASVMVMPYRTIAGASGVFKHALQYGLPVVAYDRDEVRDATIGQGGEAVFVPPNDPDALADRLAAFAADPDSLVELAERNAAATAAGPTIADVATDIAAIAAGDSA